MRIPDSVWAELQRARDQSDSWASFAGKLGINEKTAKSWIEERERDVRRSRLESALRTLRRRLAQDERPMTGGEGDTEKVRNEPDSPLSSSAIRGMTSPVTAVVPTVPSIQQEGVPMTLTEQEALVILTWRKHGIEPACKELREGEGHPAPRRSLHRRPG